MVVTTAVAAGGGAAVVTTRVRGPRLLLAPQIPIPRQQQMQTGIIIGRNVQTRLAMTTPTIIPVTKKSWIRFVMTHYTIIIVPYICVLHLVCCI